MTSLSLTFPTLKSSNQGLARAFRIALGDLAGNVQPFKDGLLDVPHPVLLAGLDYDTPWTRDAAINVWNGVGLLWPDVARNTLLSVLSNQDGRVQIAGQYWDAIIWSIGAWAYHLYTGDQQFLALAFQATQNSLARLEAQEFDALYGLFRGPAVYGDGVAAYPDRYSPGGTSSILDWVQYNPQKKAARGYGLPMMSLSTNCVYYEAYRVADRMSQAQGLGPQPDYRQRADNLRAQINRHFWQPKSGVYKYLVDPEGGCDHQEGLGHALSLLFGIADHEQAHRILENQVVVPAGVPCVWPSYERYTQLGGYGRHSGTVWPFISALWGEVALGYDRINIFWRQLETIIALINRHAQCTEIYHPTTGDPYGGLQEAGRGEHGMDWDSCARQSWTASALLRMIFFGVLGMRITETGIAFKPLLPPGVHFLEMGPIPYRQAQLSVSISGRGQVVRQVCINGEPVRPFLPAGAHGAQHIEIILADP